MAARKPQREDWIEIGPVDVEGREKIQFRHRVTGATIFMEPGLHPMDNQNAIVASDIGGSAELEAIPEAVEETATERVAAMLAKANVDNGRVKIYKILENGKLGVCMDLLPADFEAGNWTRDVADGFGAGEYEIRLYAIKPGARNTSCIGLQRVTILEDKRPKAQAVTANNDALAGVLRQMNERIDALTNRPPVDPTAQMMQSLQMFKLMREAMGVSDQHAQSPMAMVKELVAVVSGAKELRDAIEPAAVPDDPLLALAPKAMELIGVAMAQGNQQQQAPLPTLQVPATMAPPAQPSLQPNPQPTAHAIQEDESMARGTPEEREFRKALSGVNMLAMMHTSPETAANLIYEQSDENLIELLAQPDWFAKLIAFEPSLQKHQEWYQQVRDAILEIDREEKEDVNETISPSPKAA